MDQPPGHRVISHEMEIGIGIMAGPQDPAENIGARRVDPAQIGQIQNHILGVGGLGNPLQRRVLGSDRLHKPVPMRFQHRLAPLFAHDQSGRLGCLDGMTPHGVEPSRFFYARGEPVVGKETLRQRGHTRPE